MQDEGDTKICPMCAETIKAAAKVCPYCQSRLARLTRWAQELGPALMGLTLLALFAALMTWVFPEEPLAIEPGFARHRDRLMVGQTVWDRPSAKPEYYLTGNVTNETNLPWRIHELELRLLDNAGAVLDARQVRISTPFVVQSGKEHAFRVQFGEVLETNRLSHYQVRVHVATDGRRRFNPD